MTKQELQSYRLIRKEIRQLEGQIRELDTRVYSPRTPHLTGMPGAAPTEPGSAQERAATELFELRAYYDAKVKELHQKRLDIEKTIETLQDSTERIVMRSRYINGFSFEKIANRNNYSLSQIFRIHQKALRKIERCEFMR